MLQSNAQKKIFTGWRQNIKNSLNSINKSNSLHIDNDGNCYILGTTWYPDSSKDILLIKFNSLGIELWRRVYDNPSHGDDIPTNMCIDQSGNIWVCGIAKRKNDNADFLIVKFNSDGVPVNDELYDGRSHLYDCATSIAVDKLGNIYATGYETTLDSGINMMVLKCRPDGSTAWKRGYATRQMDIGNQILLDDSNNVYVCGASNTGLHTADLFLQKYNPDGIKKWQLIYDGVLSQTDAGQFISFDDSMNLYASGFMNHVNNRADIPVLKLNRNGVLIQEVIYDGHISDCDAVSLDAKKNFVYLIGDCEDYNIGVNSTFFVGYDKAGNERKYVEAPEDVSFMKSFENGNDLFLMGSKTVHPESTLIPFISICDSASLIWTFSDSTIYGLSHITYIIMSGSKIYFLGDDTGDATGTISIFTYNIQQSEKIEIKKLPMKKNK